MGLLAMPSNGGHHLAGWRHPDGRPTRGLSFDHHRHLAETAERGCFDAIFIADVVALWGSDLESLSRTTRGEHFEPLTLLAALATVTDRIGLIATATTSYNEPYHIARKFASLDHLSGGRAGWNVVTSVVGDEAMNADAARASRPAPPAIASRQPGGARMNDRLRLRAIHRGARTRAPAADVA